MSPSTFVTLSGAISFGAPLAYAVFDLARLKRTGAGPAPRRAPVTVDPPPPSGGFAPKPLPACLIEAASLSRAKTVELEPV